MLIIRPCRSEDLNDLMAMSQAVGKGMTSMPADKEAWLEKIAASRRSFSSQGANDAVGTYFMVLEDTESGKVVGTTALYTGIGLNRPFYSYKLSTLVSSSSCLETTRKTEVLSMVNDYTGATEVGSLFLMPEARRPGVGQLLSRCRYLTLADFPQHFGDTVMAELRGWQDEQGRSPLWEYLGSKFFGIEFQDAVTTAALKGTQFISDLMPKYPIYVDLLPEEARAVIGKPHESSAPALHMLKKEGFRFTGYVDLFDGGPSVQVAREEIRTVRESCLSAIEINDAVDEGDDLYMVSNGEIDDYRIALIPGRIDQHGLLQINTASARALHLDQGGQARYAFFKAAGAINKRKAA